MMNKPKSCADGPGLVIAVSSAFRPPHNSSALPAPLSQWEWEANQRIAGEWVVVDLQGPRSISKIAIEQRDVRATRIKHIEIGYSDDAIQWVAVKEAVVPTGSISQGCKASLNMSGCPRPTRYVRLLVKSGWRTREYKEYVGIQRLAIVSEPCEAVPSATEGWRPPPSREVDFFCCINDLVGPKPTGDAVENIRKEIMHFESFSSNHLALVSLIIANMRFDFEMQQRCDLGEFDFVTKECIEGLRDAGFQQYWEYQRTLKAAGLADAERVLVSLFGMLPTMQKTNHACRLWERAGGEDYACRLWERAGGDDYFLSRFFDHIASSLETYENKTPACVYALYGGLFKLGRSSAAILEDRVLLLQNPTSAPDTLALGEKSVLTSFTFLVSVNEDEALGSTSRVRIGPKTADALHEPLAFPLFGGEDKFVFPPLTCFWRRSQLDPWEASLSLQLLNEQLVPTDDIWDAVKSGDSDTLQAWLLAHPTADLETTHPQYGCCLLYSACRFGRLSCVKLLVQHCSDVNSQNSSMGSTPLHAAAWFNHHLVVKFLLEAGADPSLRNETGCTPADEKGEHQSAAIESIFSGWQSAFASGLSPSRMVTNASELKFGGRGTFLAGLRHVLGAVRTSMEAEFTGREVPEWTDRWGGPYSTRALWARAREAAVAYQSHEVALAAALTLDELTALRLYTGPSYWLVNSFLRQLGVAYIDGDEQEKTRLLGERESWAAFALVLYAAMGKLLAVQEEPSERTCRLFRGVEGRLPVSSFRPDDRGMIMFTEYGFMSTSTKPSVGDSFAGTAVSLIFEIRCRARDAFGYHSGVELEWISEIPEEAELLLPPFTVLNCISKARIGNQVRLIVVPTFVAEQD